MKVQGVSLHADEVKNKLEILEERLLKVVAVLGLGMLQGYIWYPML